jgi:tartrate-resistant acid phosphatase type 5
VSRARAAVRAASAVAVTVLAGLLGACGGETGGDAAASAPASAPSRAETVRPPALVLVKGDWGWGGRAQAAVTGRMCRIARRERIRTVITTGDNFYRPDGVATAENWTGPEACLTRLGVRWRPAWGNHDLLGDGTATALGASRRHYAFRLGPMRVIVLDANTPEDPAQMRFLRRALTTAREPVKVVVFHQPAYTAGLHAPGKAQRRLWAPLFRRHGVALVLQGHNHAYERLVVGGVTYITTGGGGAPVYPCVRLLTTGLRTCRPVHHFLRLAADERAVEVRAIDARGRILERVRVPAR